ncbi:hypothetical protein PSHT_03321, partial [Puccinia striiformis]
PAGDPSAERDSLVLASACQVTIIMPKQRSNSANLETAAISRFNAARKHLWGSARRLVPHVWKNLRPSYLHPVSRNDKATKQIFLEGTGGETYTSQAEVVNHSPGWTTSEFDGTTQIPFDLAPARERRNKQKLRHLNQTTFTRFKIRVKLTASEVADRLSPWALPNEQNQDKDFELTEHNKEVSNNGMGSLTQKSADRLGSLCQAYLLYGSVRPFRISASTAGMHTDGTYNSFCLEPPGVYRGCVIGKNRIHMVHDEVKDKDCHLEILWI